MKKVLQKKGFTLIEMLIAMSIFVIFIGLLMQSYTGIVRAHRDSNDYRIMYMEARRVFGTLVQEFRDGMVDYARYGDAPSEFMSGRSDIYLISKDASLSTYIAFEPADEEVEDSYGVIKIAKKNVTPQELGIIDLSDQAFDVNSSAVGISDFYVYVYPYVDPYDSAHVFDDGFQFHPKVTIFASFEKEKANGEFFKVKFQTTVSSRIYNQVYFTND